MNHGQLLLREWPSSKEVNSDCHTMIDKLLDLGVIKSTKISKEISPEKEINEIKVITLNIETGRMCSQTLTLRLIKKMSKI